MDPLPGKGLVKAFNVGAQGSMDAAAAPFVALGSLGRTLQGLGEGGAALAVKITTTETRRKAGEVEIALNDLFSQFETETLKSPDPLSWMDRWEKRLDEAKGRYLKEGMAPGERDALTEVYNGFASRSRNQIARNSALAIFNNGRQAAFNAIERGERSGDDVLRDNGFQQLREIGIPEPDIEKARLKSDNAATMNRILGEIEADPEGIKARLEAKREDGSFSDFPDLEQSQRRALLEKTDSVFEDRRRQEMDALEYAMNEGRLRGVDVEAANYLTPRDRQALKQSMAVKDPPSNETHARAWKMLESLRDARQNPSVTDEQYRKIWNESRGTALEMIPPRWQGDISREISYLSPAGRKIHDPNAGPEFPTKEDLASVGTSIASRALSAGIFGDVSEESSMQTREKASRKFEDIRIAVKQFAHSDPSPTVEQVRDFTDNLISGDRIKSNARDFRPFIPGAAQKLRPAPSPPVLPPKQSAKDKATSDPLQIPPGDGTASADLLPSRQLETFLAQ